MAVNSPLPVAADLKPVAGIMLGFAEANIRKPNRKDLLVMKLAPTATIAGVFTTNRFCAAPVQVCKAHLEGIMPHLRIHDLRHLFASFLVNSGRTLYEVQQILGHSDPSVTQRYAHLSSESLQKAANSASVAIRGATERAVSREEVAA